MMNDINCVVLVGRLTRDVEVSYTNSGMAIGKMSIAVNRSVRQGDQYVDEANFFDVTLFGKICEGLQQYLQKGKQVAIQGALKQDRWEKEGQKFSRVGIVADSVELLGGGQQGQSQQYPRSSNAVQQGGNYQRPQQQGYQRQGYPQQNQNGFQNQGGYPEQPFQGNGYGDGPIPF